MPNRADAPLYVVINETTVWRSVWRAFHGRPICVMHTEALFPPLDGVLVKIARWIKSRPSHCDIYDRFPEELHLFRLDPRREHHYSPYSKVEPWHDRHFSLDNADRRLGDYGYGHRQLSLAYVMGKARVAFFLDTISRYEPDARFVGLDTDILEFFTAYFGRRPPVGADICTVPNGVINALTTGFVWLASAVYVLRRLRLSETAQPQFLLVDWNGDPRDWRIFGEFERDGHSVLYVVRTKAVYENTREQLKTRRFIHLGDGSFKLGGAARALGMLTRDLSKIYQALAGTRPRLFFYSATMPLRRLKSRATLNRHPCRYYWSRDEYNVDHILRTLEVRRIGGISMGMLHAIPIAGNRLTWWRYISFDILYVFGDWIAQNIADRWPSDMKIKAVGSYGFNREQLARRRPPAERPHDILLFVGTTTSMPLLRDVIDALCTGFPDRTIYLKPKPARIEHSDMVNLRKFASRYGNLIDTMENPYSILDKARYSFSPPSTVVVEAIQVGLASFVIDEPGYQKELCFRDFPELCIASGAAAVAAIRTLEAGRAYDFRRYEPLVTLKCTHFEDFVRADMGLPPLGPPIRPLILGIRDGDTAISAAPSPALSAGR